MSFPNVLEMNESWLLVIQVMYVAVPGVPTPTSMPIVTYGLQFGLGNEAFSCLGTSFGCISAESHGQQVISLWGWMHKTTV